jgi:hypothetical protein
LLDAFPYPFHEPLARELHATLTRQFPTRAAVLALAEEAGLDTTTIYTDQAVSYLWREVLKAAAARGQTRRLVARAADRLPPTARGWPLLDDLLRGRSPRTEGEPRTRDGAPAFLSGTDDLLAPEALLYRDDLTMPMGRVPALIATLQRLVELAPAVCKLSVTLPAGLQEGTGFRISATRLLTNWHVLHQEPDGRAATAVTAEFGYDDDGAGGLSPATAIACDVSGIIGSPETDWAVIPLSSSPGDAWPVIDLAASAVPVEHGLAYIVQHPDGRRKRLGYVRNRISYVDQHVVHYLTDTEAGSSGSPVFDTDGALIALHHAGGRPQELLGRPPAIKNEGIRVEHIFSSIRATLPPDVPFRPRS